MIDELLYVLPARGYSGGANSVVQEAMEFSRMGISVRIAVDAKNAQALRSAYASVPSLASSLRAFNDENELSVLLGSATHVIGTVATSIPTVLRLRDSLKTSVRPKFYYYIQDYEPLFFRKGTPAWETAVSSYELAGGAGAFAKTDWLCDTVSRLHGIDVRKVSASIDHAIYFPFLGRRSNAKVVVSAMIRPSTSRRAPRRTARVLSALAHLHGDRVEVNAFGCSDEELINGGISLHSSVLNHGRLTREQVASLLRETDLFLDLSDYQAFGRTGLEAMACGAVTLISRFGGAMEYIEDGSNGFAVDVRNDQNVLAICETFLSAPAITRKEMSVAALKTASRYSLVGATASILEVLEGQ